MIYDFNVEPFFLSFFINVEPDQPDRAWLTDAPGLCHVPDFFLHFLTNYAENDQIMVKNYQIMVKIIRLG